MICLYRIYNRANGNYYVGSTVNDKNRWNHHRNALRKNKHYCLHLQRAWNKYGEDAFVFEIITSYPEGISLLELKTNEGRWLAEVVGLPECYNTQKDPLAPTRGMTASKETIEKRRKALTGRKQSFAAVENNRQALLKWNADRRAAGISHPNAGRKLSDERKEQMRLINLGRKHSQEFKDKVSRQWKGKPKSEEQKKKISESEKLTKSQ